MPTLHTNGTGRVSSRGRASVRPAKGRRARPGSASRVTYSLSWTTSAMAAAPLPAFVAVLAEPSNLLAGGLAVLGLLACLAFLTYCQCACVRLTESSVRVCRPLLPDSALAYEDIARIHLPDDPLPFSVFIYPSSPAEEPLCLGPGPVSGYSDLVDRLRRRAPSSARFENHTRPGL